MQDVDKKVNNLTPIVVQLLDEILPKTTIHGSGKLLNYAEIKARQKAYTTSIKISSSQKIYYLQTLTIMQRKIIQPDRTTMFIVWLASIQTIRIILPDIKQLVLCNSFKTPLQNHGKTNPKQLSPILQR